MINDNLIQNILVAIEGSEHSLAAVKVLSDQHCRSLSSRRKYLITALGVLSPRYDHCRLTRTEPGVELATR
jgi:hypothetical protein